MSDLVVQATGLQHRFAGRSVLNLPEWWVERGSEWLVSGPSGSGKSTLLSILAGLLKPTAGQVRVSDQDLSELGESERDRFRGRHIGFVPQLPHLVATLDVLENIQLAQYLARVEPDMVRIRRLMARLGLAEVERRRPHTLSRGEAQRVALARAMVNRPAILMADEPTANLDDEACEHTVTLLQESATADAATLIIATHDARLVSRFSSRLRLGGAA